MIIYLNYFIILLMFFISLNLFCSYYGHIIMFLLSLEFIMLCVLILLMMICSMNLNLNIILYYFIFVVCEAVLGLVLTMKLINKFGNNSDMTKFLNLILW